MFMFIVRVEKALCENNDPLRYVAAGPLHEQRKLSLMTGFKIGWYDGICLLRALCPGPLTHQFSMTKASLAVHMLPTSQFMGFERHPQEEEDFYARCLIGGCTSFLKYLKVFPKGIRFTVEADASMDAILLASAIRFLKAFLKHGMLGADRLD